MSQQDLNPLHHFTDHSQSQLEMLTSPTSSNNNNKPASEPAHTHAAPSWLNSALLRAAAQSGFENNSTNSNAVATTGNSFLNLHTSAAERDGAAAAAMISAAMSHDSGGKGSDDVAAEESGGGGGGVMNWQSARWKAEILSHPLYDQLLSAHVACLRIATPVDQLPRIDAQLAQSQNVVGKYSALAQPLLSDDKELDQFMVCI